MADFAFASARGFWLRSDSTIDLDSGTNITKVNVYSSTDMTPTDSWTTFSDNPPTFYSGVTAQLLINETFGAGAYDAEYPNFGVITQDAAKTIDGLIIYEDGGTDATRRYVWHCDSFTSVTPDGSSQVKIVWDNNGIFAL